MVMTNPHRTWGRKSRLVGVICKTSFEGCNIELNEKGQKEVRNTLIIRKVYLQYEQLQFEVRNATTSDCHGSFSKMRPGRLQYKRHLWTKNCRIYSNKSGCISDIEL
ncbi:hypothetical protein TNCV_2768311 [Trichonephila clavipes]|nr:hypothetical protein TNCV_2768311 [Trichonephila clavipes]